MDFKEKIAELLVPETKMEKEEILVLLDVPPNPKMGDYAFPCFRLGNPAEKARELQKKLTLPNFVAKVEVAGSYLNFFLKDEVVTEAVLREIYTFNRDYGRQNLGKGKVMAMDYSHPNIAKPFGIGHLRSTVIGNSLYLILSFLGYKPLSLNHLGDWGTQFGKLIVAYSKWGKEEELNKDPIKYLLSLYVRFHQEADLDESLNEEARKAFKRMEDGDEEYLALWRMFKDLSLTEFVRIYQILNVTFDSYQGEAFVNELVPETIEKIQQKIKTEISEGALIVNLEQFNLPPVLLLKSDLATTYHSRDLAAVFYRLKKYKADTLIYIVGAEQKLYFQQLFKVLELVGFDNNKMVHVDFGLFKFKEGKMSTRKGQVIFLEEVLNKAISLAKKIIEEKNPDLQGKDEVARQVGVGAVIFADLSNDRIRDINFDWDRMLSFEGETAPYIQYTHARACSILRKAKQELNQNVFFPVNFREFKSESELMLIKHLSKFPEVLVKVAKTYKPHHLAQYLILLAQLFNDFYHLCPVISEKRNLMKARVLLVDCSRQVLENGLNLLGIAAPIEM